ncbi:MAG: hypothetical protein KatS3mg011_1793 [Acidimicrobiia bacterium]|nr:MAG: hypothetical protein KatS3mg011_1793 [Acidimicrobiia bacterium]
MVKIYAVVLVLGVVGLVGWILFRSLADALSRPGIDPELRLGLRGRRVVAGAVGFGMAGMSAEFSPRDFTWPVALGAAVLGCLLAVWWAGRFVPEE